MCFRLLYKVRLMSGVQYVERDQVSNYDEHFHMLWYGNEHILTAWESALYIPRFISTLCLFQVVTALCTLQTGATWVRGISS